MGTEEADLAALIGAAQGGDAAALGALLRRYQGHLSRLARRRRSAPCGQRPSDLVQDTLERAARCLKQFQGRTDPELRRWLAVILHSVLLQQLRAARRQRRAVELVPLPGSDQLASPEPLPGPSEVLRGREAWRVLLRAVYALPDGQREAIHRHLHGEAVADIALALGRTPAAVSCLLQRGGKALQLALGQQGELGGWFHALRMLLAAAS